MIAAATIHVTSIEFVIANFPMRTSSAGFNGTAGSTSAHKADVTKAQPQSNAKVHSDKREKKQYCIRLVARSHGHRARDLLGWKPRATRLCAHMKARFARMTNKILEPSAILPAPARQIGGRVKLSTSIPRAPRYHSGRSLLHRTIPADQFVLPVQ